MPLNDSLICKNSDHKAVLLCRFHLVLIVINILALIIDTFLTQYTNALVEGAAAFALLINLWCFRRYESISASAYAFLSILSIALFLLIYLNSFSTMAVVFVLLLPLTTLLFIRMRYSLMLTVLLFATMAGLLYVESLSNPTNPLIQNSQALFNLAYTALIIYLFGLLYHFSIIKTFAELDASDRQKELLLKEVHHRVKNNLNIIASIVGLQANRAEGRGKEQLQLSKTRIESIAMIHEMLYKCDDFEYIDFHSYLSQLSNLLLRVFGNNQSIKVQIEADNIEMPLEVMLQLGIITNELLTNSIKYAFGDDRTGVIKIEIYKKDGYYRFLYSDDGVGVKEPEKLLLNNSLGIKLINLCVKQLKGSMSISSQDGLKYVVEFKHHL